MAAASRRPPLERIPDRVYIGAAVALVVAVVWWRRRHAGAVGPAFDSSGNPTAGNGSAAQQPGGGGGGAPGNLPTQLVSQPDQTQQQVQQADASSADTPTMLQNAASVGQPGSVGVPFVDYGNQYQPSGAGGPAYVAASQTGPSAAFSGTNYDVGKSIGGQVGSVVGLILPPTPPPPTVGLLSGETTKAQQSAYVGYHTGAGTGV